ncbi:hypothetical protein [Streptomyces sp. NPDC096033]|uniref:hypothetical protein n=1 Tax=Streptomyces sp. NPDC096033 TaxID=3366071 RepID=UPI00382E3229
MSRSTTACGEEHWWSVIGHGAASARDGPPVTAGGAEPPSTGAATGTAMALAIAGDIAIAGRAGPATHNMSARTSSAPDQLRSTDGRSRIMRDMPGGGRGPAVGLPLRRRSAGRVIVRM